MGLPRRGVRSHRPAARIDDRGACVRPGPVAGRSGQRTPHRNPSGANHRGRMAPDLREPRSVAHRSRPRFHVFAYGEPRLRSHTSIGSPATMRRTSNWRCGCNSPWPRWIGRSASLDGPKGWTCWRALDLGGNGERMSRAIGRSIRVHRFGAKSGRSQQPRAMPPPVPMALTGGATDGGPGNRQAG